MITDNFIDFTKIIKDKTGCLLGIDYGLKNVGVAISNKEKTIAMPLYILENNQQLLVNILNIINQHNVIGLIMGWPLTLDGKSVHKIGQNILFLCGNIYKKSALPTLLFDESMSTKDAISQVYSLGITTENKLIKKIGKGKDDHIAARFILQNVLHKLNNHN